MNKRARFANLTISGGPGAVGSAFYVGNSLLTAPFEGGGISNSGTLRLANSTISGNSASQNGGGVFSGGTVELYNVTIANNQADSDADDDGLGR